jgi:hypothetical protein
MKRADAMPMKDRAANPAGEPEPAGDRAVAMSRSLTGEQRAVLARCHALGLTGSQASAAVDTGIDVDGVPEYARNLVKFGRTAARSVVR